MSKHVKFLKPCGPYNEGETAHFPADVADAYVAQKIGEIVEVKAPKAEKKEVQ